MAGNGVSPPLFAHEFRNKFLKPIFDWVQANSPGSAIIPYCGFASLVLLDATPQIKMIKGVGRYCIAVGEGVQRNHASL